MNDLIRIKDKRAGRFIVDNSIIDIYAQKIKAHALAVYISLCRHANLETQQAFPSLTLIQKELSMDRRTVISSIKSLVSSGLITKKVIPGKYAIYTLLEPKLGSSKTTTGRTFAGTSSKTRIEGTKRKELTSVVKKGNGDNFGDKLLISKITKWAYGRSPNPPGCHQLAFEGSVKKAIAKFGFTKVYKTFENETNAILFLKNIKNL